MLHKSSGIVEIQVASPAADGFSNNYTAWPKKMSRVPSGNVGKVRNTQSRLRQENGWFNLLLTPDGVRQSSCPSSSSSCSVSRFLQVHSSVTEIRIILPDTISVASCCSSTRILFPGVTVVLTLVVFTLVYHREHWNGLNSWLFKFFKGPNLSGII